MVPKTKISDEIGFAEPVAVWRVTGTARTDSRFEAAHDADLTEFVGRTQEIGLLLDRWGRARSGEGQVVLISGEAGIGKSRILREFTGRLGGDGCLMLRYQCSPHEINAAFHPVIDEVEAIRRVDPAQLDQLLHPTFDPDAERHVLARGLPASPGAVCGRIVFTAEDAEKTKSGPIQFQKFHRFLRGQCPDRFARKSGCRAKPTACELSRPRSPQRSTGVVISRSV